MYLGTQKITPALVEEKSYLKLGKPKVLLDYDNDTLKVVPNPYTFNLVTGLTELYINDVKDSTFNVINTTTHYSANVPPRYGCTLNSKDLTSLAAGVYNFKANTIKQSSINDYSTSNVGAFETPIEINNIKDSDFSDEISYERWNYSITLDSTISQFYSDPLRGTLNNAQYLTGIIAVSGTIPKFTVSKENAVYEFTLDKNILTSTNNKINNSFSYAKISFTLENDAEFIIKGRSYGESNYDFGIVSTLDNELVKSNTEDSTNVLYSFKGKSSANWVNISFGTVSAGSHFFTIKYKKDASGDTDDDNFKVELPDILFSEVSTGKYLPSDISVKYNRNYEGHSDTEEKPVVNYEYDAYTGKFKIPMVGNITMTAISNESPLLDKLAITPATWDAGTAILKWKYSVNNATYHIQTPDGKEYTTTEKSFNFTNKLGEPSSDFEDYKLVKIWATSTGIQSEIPYSFQSGITKLKLIYNPNFAENHIEKNKTFLTTILPSSVIYIYNDYCYEFSYEGSYVTIHNVYTGETVYTNKMNDITGKCFKLLKSEDNFIYLLYSDNLQDINIIKYDLSNFTHTKFYSQTLTNTIQEIPLIVDLTDEYFIYKGHTDYLYRVNLNTGTEEKSSNISGMKKFINHKLYCIYRDDISTKGTIQCRIYYSNLNRFWEAGVPEYYFQEFGNGLTTDQGTLVSGENLITAEILNFDISSSGFTGLFYILMPNHTSRTMCSVTVFGSNKKITEIFTENENISGINEYNTIKISENEYLCYLNSSKFLRINTKYKQYVKFGSDSSVGNWNNNIKVSNIYNGKIYAAVPQNYCYELLL